MTKRPFNCLLAVKACILTTWGVEKQCNRTARYPEGFRTQAFMSKKAFPCTCMHIMGLLMPSLTRVLSTHLGSSPSVRQAIYGLSHTMRRLYRNICRTDGSVMGQRLKEHKRALKNFNVLSSDVRTRLGEWPLCSMDGSVCG